jgi:hypothetical protein
MRLLLANVVHSLKCEAASTSFLEKRWGQLDHKLAMTFFR